ncbi:MAG TPA: DUF6701 domain-containing protein [Gammaproteobacteria bacterium]|nr:DUF6701 domain-containing protein [Gammaproteobacteria bacterium]
MNLGDLRRQGVLIFTLLAAAWLAPTVVHAAIAFRAASQGGVDAVTTITRVAQTTGTSTTTSITINKPGGTAVNDVMIAQIALKGVVATVTPPAVGWNLIDQRSTSTAGGQITQAVYWRRVAAGEPANYTWSWTGARNAAGGITAYRGVDASGSPIDVFGAVTRNNNATITLPNVTTTTPSAMLVALLGSSRASTHSTATGMAEHYDVNVGTTTAGVTVSEDDQTLAAAGASGAKTSTIAAGAADNIAHLVALRADGNTLTINVPAGTAVNDVMIASVVVRPCSNAALPCTVTITANPDWTLVESQLQPGGGGTGGNGLQLFVYQRVVDGTEPASYTWTFGGSPVHAGAAGGIVSFSGVDTTNPIVADAGQLTASSTSHAAPSINVGTVANTMLVSTYAVNSSPTWTPPAGMTERADVASLTPNNDLGVGMEMDTQLNATTGATGTRTATWTAPTPAADTGATDMLALRPGSVITQFAINIGAASASTCAAKSITISAIDAVGNVITSYTGTINITTSSGHGDWSAVSANGTLNNGAADDGVAAYTFVASDNGVITLGLTDTHADDTTVSVVDSIVPATLSTSATINFRDNVFVITNDPIQVAGRNQAMAVALWTKDASTGNCAINTLYTGAKTLDAWITRDAQDPGGAAPTIGALSLPGAAPASNPASNNLTLTFTNGQANFNLSTTDVGKYVLNIRDDTRAFASAVDISGASNSITTRPFALVVNAIKSGATNNPAGTATGGSKFVAAGTGFQATVGAYLWSAAADANNDGVPDAGATLAQITANGLTPKYAWATALSAANPYTPAAGTLAALNNGALTAGAFAGGSATPNTLSYNEVGSFTMSVSATSFLNTAGVDLTSANGLAIVFDNGATPARNGVVGRFFPDHFTLTASGVTPACAAGGFTYMDQPALGYSFTIEARNLSNAKTANYINSPAYNTGTVSILAENNDNGTDLSSRVSAPAGSWTTGTYSFTTTIATFGRQASGAPDGPYDVLQLGVKVTDADGAVLTGLNMNPATSGACAAACTGVAIGGGTTKVRYGRVTLTGAVGSELLALPVPLQVEYYNGSGFVGKSATNLDGCTSITTAMLTPSAGTIASVPIGGGTTSGTIANNPVSQGDAGLSFSAPGAGNVGDFTLQLGLGALPWLRYDWDGNGVYNDDPPAARISFGTYGGSGRQIYIREPW